MIRTFQEKISIISSRAGAAGFGITHRGTSRIEDAITRRDISISKIKIIGGEVKATTTAIFAVLIEAVLIGTLVIGNIKISLTDGGCEAEVVPVLHKISIQTEMAPTFLKLPIQSEMVPTFHELSVQT